MNKPGLNSLKFKIPLLVLLGVIPAMLTAMGLTSYRAAIILHKEAEKDLASQAQALAMQVSQWDKMNTLVLQNLSKNLSLINTNSTQLKSSLVILQNSYQDYLWSVGVANLEGNFIALSESDKIEPINYSDREWFQGAISGNYITREIIISRRTGEPAAIFSAPIREQNSLISSEQSSASSSEKIIGVIRLGILLNELAEAVGAKTIGETGFAILVDHQGQLIAHPNSQLTSGEKLKDLSLYPPVKHLLNHHQGLFYFTDDQGVRWLSYSIHLDNKWGAIVLKKQSEVFLQVREFWQLAITIAIFSTVVIVIVMALLAHHLIQPISDLTEAVAQISQGKWHRKVQVRGQDELAILAQTFNRMAKALKESFSRLTEMNENLQASEIREREKAIALEQSLQKLQQAQSQLIQTEKMSSLGQMVAGVAHEINNPVNFIHGNLVHLRRYTQDLLELIELYQKNETQSPIEIIQKIEDIELDFIKEDLDKLLKSMHGGSSRIREIVQSLRIFSRLDESELKPVDLKTGIDSTLMLLQHRLKGQPGYPDIEIITIHENLPLVECYSGQINQVLMNIINNAIDALHEYFYQKKATDENPEYPRIEIKTRVKDRHWVSIHILDNGPGISEVIQNKIFDPFFTTKPVGKGTGLGLAVSYQIIVEKHKGELECDSPLGKGTEFIITIPIKFSSKVNF
ncbi:ATP-binding protein [Lyngbya sp. PCC 8106]|uniref:sensor histidine kinase n=1 Tax=Lyngbya sp. (strain PCC 8106) TaxID=313612 RepID=UPI0000EA9E4C|nr:ATP-binding protein [Lyngbya sp. PCC 8106]EAW39042.1 two-component sensor histidine kinase [Lyngbya sp. PCC 8106]